MSSTNDLDSKIPQTSSEALDLVDRLGRIRKLITEIFWQVDALKTWSFYRRIESAAGHPIDYYGQVRRFQIHLIEGALLASAGSQNVAARQLSLNPKTLNALIKRYNIQSESIWMSVKPEDTSLERELFGVGISDCD